MPSNFKTANTLLLILLLTAAQAYSQEPTQQAPDAQHRAEYEQAVRPFLQQHCQSCHAGESAEGEFRTDTLTVNFEDYATNQAWHEIVNVLNSHQMPPEDEIQPAPESVSKVVDWITQEITASELGQRKTQPVLRRLNRSEYGNTVGDLLGVEVDLSRFPQDAAAGGFDNNGGALTLSPMLLELYYKSAEEAIDACIVSGDQPPMLKWRIQPESGDSDSNRVEYDGQRLIVNGGQNKVVGDYKVMHHNSWDRTINFRDFAVPHAGKYRLRIRAAGKIPTRDEVVKSAEIFFRKRLADDIQENPQGEQYHRQAFERNLEHVRTDPMYDYGPPRLKLIQNLGGQPRVVAEMDIDATLDQPQEYVVETEFTTQRAGVTLEYAYSIPKELENFWFQSNDQFTRPELWIDWIELEGPLHPQWPPASHRRLLQTDQVSLQFKDEESATQHAAKVLKRWMQYAYRRPITADELRSQLQLFAAAYPAQYDFNQAITVPLTATLVSPDFLYLNPPMETPTAGLAEYQFATRLSYFLWSSLPDDELLRLAASGTLRQDAIVQQQIDRMLADPKAASFVENFVGQWLGLREVGANPPAEDLFPRYDRHLEQSMVGESEAFFAEILEQDLDVMNLVKSDFVVINQRLARYYGIANVRGDHFRRVRVPDGIHRGGVVTQASMLSTTSNGTRTSPVKRGTWILKNILGMDPGLPVANAGDIAPKVPGVDKATVRQRLEVHRSLPQCARCHNKIDPLGFALENFNAAGAWREREGFGYKGRINDDDPLIDASAQMIDGTQFVGVEGLQQMLISEEDLFLRCFAAKLITYALGRELGLADADRLRQAVQHIKEHGRTIRALIYWIVASDEFAGD